MTQTGPPTHQLTSHCGAGIAWCEMCFAMDRPVHVVLRPNLAGDHVCFSVCDPCDPLSPQYLKASGTQFALEHRQHLARAHDRDELQ